MIDRNKVLIVTTTSETLATILEGQPDYLNGYFDVSIACSPDEHFDPLTDGSGVRVFSVPMKRGITPFFDLYSIVMMVALILKTKPDLVHSYTPKAGLITMTAGWICRTRHRVHTYTGLIFPTAKGLKRKLLLFIDRLIAFFSTNVVPESEGVRTDLVENGVVSGQVSVIGNGNIAGVDVGYYSRDANFRCPGEGSVDVQPDAGGFTFTYIGRLNRDKGLNELVGAFSQLPEAAKLVLVGALDHTAPPASTILNRINSHPRITVAGFVNDIRPLLDSSDVLVLPSYREGFPNVVLQAMAMSVPVISTDVSGANEVVIPMQTGWLVPVRDEDALRRAMLEAMTTSSRVLDEMGARCRRLIVERFERGRYLQSLVAFYRALFA